MELLGSGEFKYWTRKKKHRVLDRALEQADASSEVESDKQIAQLMKTSPPRRRPAGESSSLMALLYEYLRVEPGSTVTERSCWFTLMSESQLITEGDVLCLGAFIPPGRMNLPLCSVSPALVLGITRRYCRVPNAAVVGAERNIKWRSPNIARTAQSPDQRSTLLGTDANFTIGHVVCSHFVGVSSSCRLSIVNNKIELFESN